MSLDLHAGLLLTSRFSTAIRPTTLNTAFFATAAGTERPDLVARSRECETLQFVHRINVHASLDTIWHQQYIANPPPVSVEVEVAFALVSKRSCSRAVIKVPERVPIENQTGLTWGDVVDEIRIAVNTANETELRYGVKWKVDTPLCKIWMRVSFASSF